MTSQVAVYNLNCVAVASDSLSTVTSGHGVRTLASAEKIFDLGPAHRVVAMTSGNAEFMSIPWSVLVGEWSRSLKDPLSEVRDYAGSFTAWLNSRTDLFDPARQESHFAWQLSAYFGELRDEILERRDFHAAVFGANYQAEEVDAADDLRAALEAWEGLGDLECVDAERDAQFIKGSEELIRQAFNNVFRDVPALTLSDPDVLEHVARMLLTKHLIWGRDATMAFIGYGADGIFPSQQVSVFHGFVGGVVRVATEDVLVTSPASPSNVIAFAQRDAISGFMYGRDPSFVRQAHDCVDDLLDELYLSDEEEDWKGAPAVRGFVEKLHLRLDNAFDIHAVEKFLSPLVAVVQSLSRTEMARLAESLVGIQALRANSLGQMPTVGGPIDVVVVSRKHGVEWIHRKDVHARG